MQPHAGATLLNHPSHAGRAMFRLPHGSILPALPAWLPHVRPCMSCLPGERAHTACMLASCCRQSASHRGGCVRRWVATLSTSEGEAGLKRIGRLLYEAAGQFYLEDSKRRLALHGERRNPPPDLNARIAFKVPRLGHSLQPGRIEDERPACTCPSLAHNRPSAVPCKSVLVLYTNYVPYHAMLSVSGARLPHAAFSKGPIAHPCMQCMLDRPCSRWPLLRKCTHAAYRAQAAALSEFRADWATAVRTYETAYRELAKGAPTPATPLQRFAELAAVAEVVHLKVPLLACYLTLALFQKLAP